MVTRVWRGPTRTGFTYDALPGHPEMGTETFLRVHDTTGADVPEDDLFAGLR